MRSTANIGRTVIVLTLLLAASAALALAPSRQATAGQPVAPDDPHVLAHYYIWFDATSWNRAKVDYPALGRYSSDEASTMRRHVEMAKEVGIDGFIVSWKSTAALDARLEELVAIAEELDFKLAITYQGLDFNRDPLPTDRIEADLDTLTEEFAASPAFDLFDKPLVVLTGTWEFTEDELAQITDHRRDDLLVLGSEKSVEGYGRVAPYVDGNLYYWSSVNPETNPEYPQKLVDMGDAVRRDGGLWIAPAAPGFDARLVGGEQVVERRDGETLRDEWQGALSSLPAAVGIISWNEFSENTHIEPSLEYGSTALGVVADLTGSPKPSAVDFDSSAPEGPPRFSVTRFLAIGLFLGVIGWSLYHVYRRRTQQRRDLRDSQNALDRADGEQPAEL